MSGFELAAQIAIAILVFRVTFLAMKKVTTIPGSAPANKNTPGSQSHTGKNA